jgi:hypothetical protein
LRDVIAREPAIRGAVMAHRQAGSPAFAGHDDVNVGARPQYDASHFAIKGNADAAQERNFPDPLGTHFARIGPALNQSFTLFRRTKP